MVEENLQSDSVEYSSERLIDDVTLTRTLVSSPFELLFAWCMDDPNRSLGRIPFSHAMDRLKAASLLSTTNPTSDSVLTIPATM